MQASAAVVAAPLVLPAGEPRAAVIAPPHGVDELKVGIIGCGGRGTGAAVNALEASPRTRIVALADVFAGRMASCREHLASLDPAMAARAAVPDERCFEGFGGCHRLIESGVDMVVLATPPHFRPMQFEAAIRAGKHVFMEKPVAVDAPGVRRVLSAAEEADRRGLCVVAGTQRRHERSYREAMERLRSPAGSDGIGTIVAARCSWNQGGLWMHSRKPEWSDMEWQLRNWLYFTWLSGDHIVEQHVHNLDVINWAMGAHPVKAAGMGGRQVRTDPAYGHVFDHFAVEFEYPGGAMVTSMCRQIDGCDSRVEELLIGTHGRALLRPGYAAIDRAGPGGQHEHAWAFEGEDNNPYVQEIVDLIEAIDHGPAVNEARAVAESTLTAIMGRMSAYTGREVTWEQALNSTLDLSPPAYEFGPLATPEVAVPGRTPLV
jgi:predicted dehydrogenase